MSNVVLETISNDLNEARKRIGELEDERDAALARAEAAEADAEALAECRESYEQLATQLQQVTEWHEEELAALRAQLEWRPVTEPPTDDGQYLVITRPNRKYQANGLPGKYLYALSNFVSGHRLPLSGDLNEWPHHGKAQPVTHWMPLPAPPQEAHE